VTAYVVIRITVNNAEKLKEYQQVAPTIIEQYNGKILVRGSEVI
jgi:uncharacterized protein (DUF1330 family)